ncbi:MAG: hypothetical protein U9N30_11150, partial [Campylobacterota bacterium]|nr:hypothetical protein [Campylobacterota bacterium]
KLKFGELLGGAIADLESMQDATNQSISGMYSWSIKGSKKIVSDAKVMLSEMAGSLNIGDIANPKILFNAKADLSLYGGVFSSVKSASVQQVIVSKEGLSGSALLELNDINIWSDKNVRLHFNRDPKLNFSAKTSGFSVGLDDIDANIHFGDLLNGAQALISRVGDATESASKMAGFEDRKKQTQEFINNAYEYAWELSGNYPLLDDSIVLNALGGSLDFSDLGNPSITLNANAVLDSTAYPLFKFVQSVGVQNATISKKGFEGSLSTTLESIPIWEDKNVQILFDQSTPPTFSLAISSSGVKLGVENLSGEIDFGTLIKEAKATLSTVSPGILSWGFSNAKQLEDTAIALKELAGQVDLQDLKNPSIELNGKVNLGSYFEWFESLGDIDLQNARITRSGFSAEVSAQLDDISVWGEKEVKVLFNNGSTPTFSLAVNREGINLGLSDIDASLDFGTLISQHTVVNLKALASQAKGSAANFSKTISGAAGSFQSATSGVAGKLQNQASALQNTVQGKVQGAVDQVTDATKDVNVSSNEGIYTWSLSGQYPFVDSNGTVQVSSLGGTLNLKNIRSPIVSFDAQGDFSQYTLPGNVSVDTVAIDDATISRSGIDWNIIFSGLDAQYVIYDLGEPTVEGTEDEADVRIVLSNMDGSAGDSGVEVGSASGFLAFGDLFETRVEPIELTYESSGTYGFNTSQVFTYSSGDNIITFNGLGGTVQKVGSSYKVVVNGGDIILQTALLSTSSGENTTVTLNNLEVSQSGFKGILVASWGVNGHNFEMINGKIVLNLTAVGVAIDTQASPKVSLSQFDGYVDLSEVFDETADQAKAALSLLDSNINWSFDHDLSINTNYLFKGLNGNINFSDVDALSVGFGGEFGYLGWDEVSLVLDNFSIGRAGLNGSILLDGAIENIAGIPDLDLTQLGVAFAGIHSISGTIGLDYASTTFLGSNNLDLGFSATLGLEGIEEFAIRGELPSVSVESFAQMTFTGMSMSPSLDDFWVELSGNILPDHSLLSSLQSVEFAGLRISKTGVNVSRIAANIDVSGASTTLGGLNLSLEELQLGYDNNLLYISIAGKLGLEIAQAGAGLTIFSDGSYEIYQIQMDINHPGLSMSGKLTWYTDDEVYGNGFAATGLKLGIAQIFDVDGEFRIGKKNSGQYWMAKAMVTAGGSGIPLTPLPLSIYGFGGGVAYGMDVVVSGMTATYVPNGQRNVVVEGALKLGTNDTGYTWHGTFGLSVDLSNGNTALVGNSYLLSELNETPADKWIGGSIVFANNPFSLDINGGVRVMYKVGSMELAALLGHSQIYYSSAKKFVHLGTKDSPIEARAFGISAMSYLMIDADQFAMGASFSASGSWEGEVCDPFFGACVDSGFGVRYGGYVKYDALVGYGRSIFIDLYGAAGVSVEGRIPVYGWFDVASIDAAIHFRTPSPTFLSLYARGCCCSGCASHTFYLIGNS